MDQAEEIKKEAEQSQSVEQQYVASVPVEPESKNPGRVQGIISLVCAAISFLFFPPVFGILGIVLGIKARKKGARRLGLVGIILSSVFMALGMIIGLGLAIWRESNSGSLEGITGVIF